MRNTQKIIFVMIQFLICITLLIGTNTKVQLKLPVRIFADHKPVVGLDRDDFYTYKKDKTVVEKSLLNKIQRVRIALANSTRDKDYDISRYKTAIQFINNYPIEFLGFKKRFLLPDSQKIKQIVEQIAFRGGDKWWIHFQQREISVLFPKTRDIIKKLNWYETLADYNLGYKQGLSHMQKQLQLSYSFPSQEMIKIFLQNNISYNVVLYSGKKNLDLNNVQSEISDLEIILDKISRPSGGKMVSIMTPEQGIKEIEKHWDFYFELGFNYNGRLEEKQFKINLKNRNANLLYPDNLLPNEVKSLIKDHLQGKIKIGNLAVKKNGVNFSVNLFKLHRTEKYGIIKVRISLSDEQNTIVYNKNNTLRAFKEKISVSIPIPTSFSGRYRIKIVVFDMIGNQSDSADDFFQF